VADGFCIPLARITKQMLIIMEGARQVTSGFGGVGVVARK
jgi:hypothetical protein